MTTPSLSTEISPGETLDLSVKVAKYNTGVWVDWNENGLFDDPGEFIGYNQMGNFKISIPEGISVTPGAKRMRIVHSNLLPSPCGAYTYGETEDYTLIVVPNPNDPSISVDLSNIDKNITTPGTKAEEVAMTISNNGGTTLNGKLRTNYTLPTVPAAKQNIPTKNRPVISSKTLEQQALDIRKAPSRSSDENIIYTLQYDFEQKAAININNVPEATFAHYYPSEVIKSVKGLEITSIDVYIAEAPKSTTIVIYGPGSTICAGKEIYSQKFTPVANSWNHVVLTKPVMLDGNDIWFGIRMSGMNGTYHMGTDSHYAIAGYGDLIYIGGDIWWPMSDLGVDNNFCIRANLSGKPTPAISWLSLDKTDFSIEPKANTTVKAMLDVTNLENALYEASIMIDTNDGLASTLTIPVYLSNGITTGIDTTNAPTLSVKVVGTDLEINAAQEMEHMTLYDVKGSARLNEIVGSTYGSVSLEPLESGIYIIKVTYADGKTDTVKIAVAK